MMKNLVKFSLIALLGGISTSIFAQNVGINTTGATPSVNAILDLNTGNAKNMGLLIPRVVLGTSLSTFNPPMANASSGKDSGLMVFNWLATNQPVGYYCWTGSTWLSVAANNSFVWLLNGNSGSAPSTALIGSPVNNNFFGTTDAKDIVFATNNLERMRITSTGNIGIGTKNPTSTLDDSGSIGTGTTKISPAASTTTALGSGYSTIIATPTAIATTYTLTLPSATTSSRRIYTVVYNGSGLGTIDITSPVAGNIVENGANVTPLAISQGTVTLQSDGTNWDVLNITTANAFGSFVGIKYITSSTGSALAFDAGTDAILVKVIGGGGAGGGGSTNGACSSNTDAAGSGGGAGGYVEGFLNGLSGSSTYSVTIGAGGAGNSNCSGNGGSGGQTTLTIVSPATTYIGLGGTGGVNNNVNNNNAYASGGAGGGASSTASAGTYITITGATGASSLITNSGTHVDASGTGAGTPFGPGGSSLAGRQVAEPGVSAVCYGAGGGGSIIAEETNTTEAGGNGFKGVVIIYEYQ